MYTYNIFMYTIFYFPHFLPSYLLHTFHFILHHTLFVFFFVLQLPYIQSIVKIRSATESCDNPRACKSPRVEAAVLKRWSRCARKSCFFFAAAITRHPALSLPRRVYIGGDSDGVEGIRDRSARSPLFDLSRGLSENGRKQGARQY